MTRRPGPAPVRAHLPHRPLWLCRTCAHPWPCGPARLALLAEFQGERTALLMFLASLMIEADAHLAALHPDAPPTDLAARFLGWARARNPERAGP